MFRWSAIIGGGGGFAIFLRRSEFAVSGPWLWHRRKNGRSVKLHLVPRLRCGSVNLILHTPVWCEQKMFLSLGYKFFSKAWEFRMLSVSISIYQYPCFHLSKGLIEFHEKLLWQLGHSNVTLFFSISYSPYQKELSKKIPLTLFWWRQVIKNWKCNMKFNTVIGCKRN
jgi:hypothetical protein